MKTGTRGCGCGAAAAPRCKSSEARRAHLPNWLCNLAWLRRDLPDGAALVRDAAVASHLVVKRRQERLDVHGALRSARVPRLVIPAV